MLSWIGGVEVSHQTVVRKVQGSIALGKDFYVSFSCLVFVKSCILLYLILNLISFIQHSEMLALNGLFMNLYMIKIYL